MGVLQYLQARSIYKKERKNYARGRELRKKRRLQASLPCTTLTFNLQIASYPVQRQPQVLHRRWCQQHRYGSCSMRNCSHDVLMCECVH